MKNNHQIEQKNTLRRVASASFIGNFVEWFDYAAYGFLATVIAVVFFPKSDPLTALMATYAIFAISFIFRPLGGIFWGHVGDKFGRKNALSWSIILMTLATVCIALLPSYQSIGIFAPIMLLIFRMIQGFSASGEYAGAANFLAEYAPKGKRGLYTSLVPASTATGLLLGSLMAAAMFAFMSEAFLHEYGWRIPFLLAAPLGLIGYYIRVKLEETPEFLEHQKNSNKENFPIKALFTQYQPALFKAFAVASLNATAFYLIFSYMPNYLATELGVNKSQAFISGSISLLFYIAVVFVMGKYSDGSLPAYLTEQFPIQVRYTGFAFSFNTANALLGGTVPFVATWLIQQTANTLAPSILLVIVAIFASMALLERKSHHLINAKA